MSTPKPTNIIIRLEQQIDQALQTQFPTLPKHQGTKKSTNRLYTYYQYIFGGTYSIGTNKCLTVNLSNGLIVEFELIKDVTSKKTVKTSNSVFPSTALGLPTFHCKKVLTVTDSSIPSTP